MTQRISRTFLLAAAMIATLAFPAASWAWWDNHGHWHPDHYHSDYYGGGH